jgi:hypothetical protein
LEGDWWRCSLNSGHYWAWRDEQSGHAIRNFLTRPHPNKLGPFYTVSREARPEPDNGNQPQAGSSQSPAPAQRKSIFELAREAVEARADRFPDEIVTLFESGRLRVTLRRYQDLILMTALNSDPARAEQIQVGQLSPRRGWTFSLERRAYEKWAERAQRLAGEQKR